VIDLSGRVVIVTGGNSGIGLGIARGVARAGASVAIWSRRAERNAEAAAELEGLGATAIGVQCDVSNEDNVAAATRATPGRYGRLDCLVANAGTAAKQAFTDMTLGEWHRVLHVNLDGTFLCLREATRVLAGQGQAGHWPACRRPARSTGLPASSTTRPARPRCSR
jgi:NAD(P)-dependent dehydrogenase (short-subunit alcohol dehydrogenase family)